jgi:hypothetical protein
MSIQATLLGRREELRRRVEALPKEIEAWRARSINQLDLQAHHSQLEAIQVLMAEYTNRQQMRLNDLDPGGDAETFRREAWALIKDVIKAQEVWDFFRDKLELRFSPTFKDVLWVADTVAWDCYRPVIEAAADEDILPRSQLREPPLTYLTAEFSPATWVRGSRPKDGRDYDLGTATLPIPVIELPWDHVENIWEFLTLHHEVGHDLEADFKLRPVLQSSLKSVLTDAHVPPERIRVWVNWQGEVFADLVALQLAGPAFAEVLAYLLLLPEAYVVHYQADDPHPTHYLRVLMNAAYMRTLAPGTRRIEQHAAELERWWKALYGEQPQFQAYTADFPHVFRALMDSPLEPLKRKTVRSLQPFSADDDARIRAATKYLLTGQDKPPTIRPRHCLSAARLAVAEAAANPATLADSFQAINRRTATLVRDNAAPGLRAGDDSERHRRFIAGFADTIANIG